MLTSLEATAAGWAVGRRTSPVTWIAGAVFVTAICLVGDVVGWSFSSAVEGLLGLMAFNVIAQLSAMIRPHDIPPPMKASVKARKMRAPLQPLPKTWA